MKFSRALRRILAIDSRLCVGLDPRFEQTGAGTADQLRRSSRTLPVAAAFKPNVAISRRWVWRASGCSKRFADGSWRCALVLERSGGISAKPNVLREGLPTTFGERMP